LLESPSFDLKLWELNPIKNCPFRAIFDWVQFPSFNEETTRIKQLNYHFYCIKPKKFVKS